MTIKSSNKKIHSLAKRKEKAAAVALVLEQLYPDAECALESGDDPWKLLVMARLSAQCTDKRVNEIAPFLFAKYPTVWDMAEADLGELEKAIQSCGLFRTKAKSLKESSQQLVQNYDGKVPDTMEDLLSLSGVGRKIANLLLGDIFHKPGIVADTHCIRIAARLGLTYPQCTDPLHTETLLCESVEESIRADFCHRIVHFGRDTCRAQNPQCATCPMASLCEWKKTPKK